MRRVSRRLKRIYFTTGSNTVQTFSSSDYINDIPSRFHVVSGVEVVSHLLLQMTLHFNIYYSFPWMLSLIIGLELKFSFLLSHYKYVTVAVYVILFTVEMLRLYLGYEGNLREKVAELAGFWLLTVLQLLLVLYLVVNVNTVLLPLEFAVNGPLLFFLFVQIVTGFRSLQLMIQAQKVKYHISLLKFGQSLQNIEKLDQFDLN